MFAQKELKDVQINERIKDTPIDTLESDLQLLGVTALEDLMQDKVA
jgi:magnesium-transporting ATPase (P-type)